MLPWRGGLRTTVADAKRFLLVWLDERGALDRPTLGPIRRAMEDQIKDPPERVEIDLGFIPQAATPMPPTSLQ